MWLHIHHVHAFAISRQSLIFDGVGEEHDSDAGPTVSRGNPTGEPKRNQLEIELVGVRGGGPRSKQVSVSVSVFDEPSTLHAISCEISCNDIRGGEATDF